MFGDRKVMASISKFIADLKEDPSKNHLELELSNGEKIKIVAELLRSRKVKLEVVTDTKDESA